MQKIQWQNHLKTTTKHFKSSFDLEGGGGGVYTSEQRLQQWNQDGTSSIGGPQNENYRIGIVFNGSQAINQLNLETGGANFTSCQAKNLLHVTER